MKKSKKIIAIVVAVVILLVAIGLTLYFCLWHNKQNPPDSGNVGDQGNFTYSTPSGIGIEASKTEVAPGDTFTLSVELGTSRTDVYWWSISFIVAPMLNDTTVYTDFADNFELVECKFSDPISNRRKWINNTSDFFNKEDGGVLISLSFNGGEKLPSTSKISFTMEIKVKETAPAISDLSFGIIKNEANMLNYATEDTNTVIFDCGDGTTVIKTFGTNNATTNNDGTDKYGLKTQTVKLSIVAN